MTTFPLCPNETISAVKPLRFLLVLHTRIDDVTTEGERPASREIKQQRHLTLVRFRRRFPVVWTYNGQTHLTLLIDVRMVDLGFECDLRRLEGIFCRECDLDLERTFVVRRVLLERCTSVFVTIQLHWRHISANVSRYSANTWCATQGNMRCYSEKYKTMSQQKTWIATRQKHFLYSLKTEVVELFQW